MKINIINQGDNTMIKITQYLLLFITTIYMYYDCLVGKIVCPAKGVKSLFNRYNGCFEKRYL